MDRPARATSGYPRSRSPGSPARRPWTGSPRTEGPTVLARHRSPGGQAPSSALDDALDGAVVRVRGSHRLPAPSSALRGRVVVAAVAAGAFAAAAAGQTLQGDQPSAESDNEPVDVTPMASAHYASAHLGQGGAAPAGVPAGAPALLPVAQTTDAATEAQQLVDSEQVTQQRKEREAAAAREAARPKFVVPADGVFSSGFGARWGTSHNGIDLANSIGTPIVAAADGVVIEAGPASGFGLWVRVQHDDGTITVYGHIHSFSVSVGQQVEAGDQIAQMGNRGHSTGSHLHFEVWTPSGKKIDPRSWLASHGVNV